MPTGETGPSPCSSPRQQHQFDFQPTQRLRRPRAWDRAPTSPFGAHIRGRKVWKRHGLLGNKSGQHAHLPRQIEDEEEKEEQGVESPKNMGARPIKRLRVNKEQAALCADKGGPHQKSPVKRYITTLHDKAPETPKRKRPLRKSLRPDGFLRKGERKKTQSLEVTTTTIIETCQVALGKDDQLLDASSTADTDAASSALEGKCTPSHVETVLAACTNGNEQRAVSCAVISQTDDAVGDDQSNTAGAAIDQAIEALYDEQYLTPSEILSPTSPAMSASTTAYTADEISRIADGNPSEAGGGVLILIEIPPQSSAEDTFATNSLQCGTRLNDRNTREIHDASSEQTEQVGRLTRSTPRFSDDTNLLKDFLSRAQAKKAAKEDQSNVSARMILPRLSPRAALADVTLSPPQPTELASRPGNSPVKQQDALEVHGDNDDDDDDDDGDDNEEEEEEEEKEGVGEEKRKDGGDNGDEGEEKLDGAAIEIGSCRRSTRTRFFTPAKTAVITRIPVRRADGTEPIVLQKSEAQALALATRNNTRRNKGQSKPPKLTLEKFPAEAVDEVTIAPSGAEKRGKGKAVGWDEKVVYHLDSSEWQEGGNERRARLRRLRKLGAVNGTPAPKKAFMELDSSNESNEDGARKGRRKSKGRVAR